MCLCISWGVFLTKTYENTRKTYLCIRNCAIYIPYTIPRKLRVNRKLPNISKHPLHFFFSPTNYQKLLLSPFPHVTRPSNKRLLNVILPRGRFRHHLRYQPISRRGFLNHRCRTPCAPIENIQTTAPVLLIRTHRICRTIPMTSNLHHTSFLPLLLATSLPELRLSPRCNG